MTTRYAILPPSQRSLLPALTPIQALGYVLYGGTAIALRIGHRASIDFDFFTDRGLDRDALIDAAPFLSASRTLSDEMNSWTVQMDAGRQAQPVKLSFFAKLGFGRVGDPTVSDGGELLMASREDLLGHKLKVILQRAEAKDYQDIAALLDNGETLERGVGAAMSLFALFPSSDALRALVYFDDGDVPLLSRTARATLIGHVDRFTEPVPMPILARYLGPTGA